MTDTDTKPDEVIPPAATDAEAFDALMAVAHEHGGFSEIIYRMGIKAPALFDPAQARVNAHAIATALRKAANQLCDATRLPGQPRVRELYSIHGEASGIWFCEKCRYTCRNEEEATCCCAPRVCDKCKETLKAGSYFCDPCWSKEQAEKAAERWAKAEPIEADAYTGAMFYVETEEGLWYGGSHEGYFSSFEELGYAIDDHIFEGSSRPTLHVYATTPQKISFDAADMLENALSDFHDGASDDIASSAQDDLQKFLDAWCEENSPTTYFQDTTKKIIGWEDYVPPAECGDDQSDPVSPEV